MKTNKTICRYCKTPRPIPDDEHDDVTCVCGKEEWVKEGELEEDEAGLDCFLAQEHLKNCEECRKLL